MTNSWKRLVIDTATKCYYLALLEDEKVIYDVYEMGFNDHSATLLPKIEMILNTYNLKLTDINEVIVGIGPGSYTGVRIGVVIAKMIGYMNNVDVYTVSSLALIASSCDDEFVLANIDARRNNGFLGFYHNNSNGSLELVLPEAFMNVLEYKEQISNQYVEAFGTDKPKINKILNSNLLKKIDDIHALVPNYLQLTEAERNKHGN